MEHNMRVKKWFIYFLLCKLVLFPVVIVLNGWINQSMTSLQIWRAKKIVWLRQGHWHPSFLDGEWQGNHMHFTSTSNASLGVINWNAIAGEKMSWKERTASIKSTSQQLNPIQPLSAQDWYEQQLGLKRKTSHVQSMNLNEGAERSDSFELWFHGCAWKRLGVLNCAIMNSDFTIVGSRRGTGLCTPRVPQERDRDGER